MPDDSSSPSNLMNASMMRSLVRKEAALEAKKKAAIADLNAHHKLVKTLGVDVKNFLAIYKQATAKDDGDKFIQDLREQRRMAQLLNLPLGHQFSLMDEFDAAGKIDEEIGVKAYRDGARAHLDHIEESLCPHAAGTVAANEWLRGWRYSEQLCGDGDREIEAIDNNRPGPDEAAKGTKPAEPTEAGKAEAAKSAPAEKKPKKEKVAKVSAAEPSTVQ